MITTTATTNTGLEQYMNKWIFIRFLSVFCVFDRSWRTSYWLLKNVQFRNNWNTHLFTHIQRSKVCSDVTSYILLLLGIHVKNGFKFSNHFQINLVLKKNIIRSVPNKSFIWNQISIFCAIFIHLFVRHTFMKTLFSSRFYFIF